MNSVEIFAGAGGLAIGVAQAGFHHQAIVERDRWACNSIRENKARLVGSALREDLSFLPHWPEPFQGDVREFDYTRVGGPIHIVSGGPPCQPFSVGGKHKGDQDSRDMFPEAARAVRELRPKVFMFENVRGLLREKFAEYFEYVFLRLTYPEVVKKEAECWNDHLSRLERHHSSGSQKGLVYNVSFRALNAADYGVPQRRARVILVGFRSDLGVEWSFPESSHSRERLLWEQWVTGEYWDEHGIATSERPTLSETEQRRVARLRERNEAPPSARWRTVRDALRDIPDPEHHPDRREEYHNHQFQAGARSYKGHTGSPPDLPAKTLKAGVHGVPGGENMLARYDGSVRYFSIREAARLQTFPDQYALEGAWSEAMRQLGNAVPVRLARVIADSIATSLDADALRQT